MSRTLLIGVALVGVVGAGLWLSRRPAASAIGSGASSNKQSFSSLLNSAGGGASVTDPMNFGDPQNVPSLVGTGESPGPSSMITPDSLPAHKQELVFGRRDRTREIY